MQRITSIPRTIPLDRHARRIAHRHASSTPSRARSLVSTTLVIGGTVAFVAYYYDSRSVMHEHVVMPLMRLFDPETGHKTAVRLLSGPSWTRPRDRGVDAVGLQADLFGQRVVNPIGMAAGFDKDGEAIGGLFDLGFGYVEIGSVTPEPQPGNPLPRFFRLGRDQACINRYGFNSLGHGQTLSQLRARLTLFAQSNPSLFPSPLPSILLPPDSLPRSLRPGHVLAVNLGKNKTSRSDSNDDYVKGVRTLGPYADVVVINVSSPNTPGLRALQGREVLEKLLNEVVGEREKIKSVDGLPKIAVKVACDLSEEELGDVAAAVRHSGVDGVIVSNTTVRRAGLGLKSIGYEETGGLSGRPLFPYALHALKTLRPLLPPTIPLIGCGGVTTGEDALTMARAGASLVQIYTTFGYRGVGTPRLLKDEVAKELHGSGTTWRANVGADWPDGVMGWSEDQLRQESEKVKREAEGLGQLLREMNDEVDMERLVREAEETLGRWSKQEETVEVESPASSSQSEASAEIPAIEGKAGILDALEGAAVETPRLIEFRPVVVAVEPEAGRDDEWTNTVRSGQRRLV